MAVGEFKPSCTLRTSRSQLDCCCVHFRIHRRYFCLMHVLQDAGLVHRSCTHSIVVCAVAVGVISSHAFSDMNIGVSSSWMRAVVTIISCMAPRFVSNCIRAATSVAVARCPLPCTVCRQPIQGSTALKAFTAAEPPQRLEIVGCMTPLGTL